MEAFKDAQDNTAAGVVRKALVELAQKHKEKVIIYTSGVWSYGFTQEFTDESSPINPIDAAKGRIVPEKEYLEVGATVIRAGVTYGQAGALTGLLFKSLKGSFRSGSDR